MNKFKKYKAIILLVLITIVLTLILGTFIYNCAKSYIDNTNKIQELESTLETKNNKKAIILKRKKERDKIIQSSPKRIYAPIESVSGNDDDSDTLFFTLYNDVIEMLHNNSIKVKSMDYVYSPENDNFVLQAGEQYIVCDVNLEILSNYKNLGNFIQDVYKYPYYIKINKVDVKPYAKDKKVLISNISLRLYAHTEPQIIRGVEEIAQ